MQVQDSYYGQQEARIGHFPSSIVEETHPLSSASTEVQTTVGEHTHLPPHTHFVPLSPNSIAPLISRNGTSTVTDVALINKKNNKKDTNPHLSYISSMQPCIST